MKKRVFVKGILLVISGVVLLPGCFKGVGEKASQTSCAMPDVTLRNALSKENIVDLLIIGSGSAGWPAAIYGARNGLNTWIIQGQKPGGALTETSYVENWPGNESILGKDLMTNLKKHAEKMGAHILSDVVERVNFNVWPFEVYTQEGFKISALSVIVATGSTPLVLGVKGEKEFWGIGVTTCAVCDAAFYKEKDVVVIGGGDTAVEEALLLARYAKNVTILVRKDKMRAAASMQEKLKGYENITVLYNREVKEIKGDKHVTGITVFDNNKNETYEMPINGVFLAIGHMPNSSLFKDYLPVDDQGYIKLANRSQNSCIPGVFVAGDVEDHVYRQAIVAAGNGVKAALDAWNFLIKIGYNDELVKQIETNRFNPDVKQESFVKIVKTIDELDAVLEQAEDKPVVLDFFAEYCPSCMHMLPVFESVAQKFEDQAVFVKIDAAVSPEIMQKYKVYKVPALLVLKNKTMVTRYNKTMDRQELFDVVMKYLDSQVK